MLKLIFASAFVFLFMIGESFAQQKKPVDRPFFFEPGFDFSTGDYGTARDTDIVSVPFTLGYRHRLFEISGTLSYLHISNTGFVIPSLGGPASVSETSAAQTPSGAVPAPTPRNPTPVIADEASGDSTSGFGDIMLQGTAFLLDEKGNWPSFYPWLSVKIPTANEDKGLGTGKTDVGFGAVIGKTFGRGFGSVNLGYTFIGEPSGVDLDNVFSSVITAGYNPLDPLSIYGFFDYKMAVVDKVDDPISLGFGASYLFSDWLALRGEMRFGATESAPDVGANLALIFRF